MATSICKPSIIVNARSHFLCFREIDGCYSGFYRWRKAHAVVLPLDTTSDLDGLASERRAPIAITKRDGAMSCFTYFRSMCALGLSLAALASDAYGYDQGRTVEVIKPPEQTSRIKPAAIDSERFEFGPYAGFVSVEDFGANTVTGLALGYHVSHRFLAQLNYGRASIGRAAFEDVIDGEFLAENDRNFVYQSLLGGYMMVQGRSFLGRQRKFNSHIYLMAGAGKVSFAGQDNPAIVFGIDYKTVLTDWLIISIDFRDIAFERAFLGSSKTTHNTEVTVNLSVML